MLIFLVHEARSALTVIHLFKENGVAIRHIILNTCCAFAIGMASSASDEK